MFTLTLLIGIYSYIIFFLGLTGFLYKPTVIITSLVFVFVICSFMRRNLKEQNLISKLISFAKRSTKFNLVFLVIILLQGLVSLIGALGPELGFDALWYHLTLPKIYLENHSIDYVPGGVLYYSAMPKLTEMLYISALSFGTEIGAKLIHFFFGILSLIALYNLSRKFLSKTFSLLVLVLFYSNLVVGFLSITAYIDLARTFFEIMALWAFVEWQKKKNTKLLIESAAILGLAISTKLLALGSLPIFTFLIFFAIFQKYKLKWKSIIINMLLYWWFALLIPLPWFFSSFINTGSPVYPFFTNIYPIKIGINLINPLDLSDPISPFYVIMLPAAIFIYKKFNFSIKLIFLYSFLSIFIWYLTPQTGGGRFILPYLPAFSIISVVVINKMKNLRIQKLFIGSIVFLSLFSILYRGVANSKYIPVILGKETKSQFLTKHLNFSFGDFYDTDGYFSKKIKKDDIVLLYGFHNLYYVNFPFIDASYVKKGDTFNYVAIQGNNTPWRFRNWNLIYYNKTTGVKLYSIGGLKWVY